MSRLKYGSVEYEFFRKGVSPIPTSSTQPVNMGARAVVTPEGWRAFSIFIVCPDERTSSLTLSAIENFFEAMQRKTMFAGLKQMYEEELQKPTGSIRDEWESQGGEDLKGTPRLR